MAGKKKKKRFKKPKTLKGFGKARMRIKKIRLIPKKRLTIKLSKI